MDIEKEASRLLLGNRRSGYSPRHGLDYSYTCPSPIDYPYQWFWDSCFHAIALSHLDPEWAKRELQSLVSVQRPDGYLPHVIFWRGGSPTHYWRHLQADNPLRPRVSIYIQPPVLALAALAVFRVTGDHEFGARMLAAARGFHDWLRAIRDPDRDGLISIVSPFESGLDWSPQFDPVFNHGPNQIAFSRWLTPRVLDLRHWLARHDDKRMLRHFDVEEVLTNSIWYEAQRSLAALASELGDEQLAQDENEGAARTQEAILGKCWDVEARAFFSLGGRDESRLRILTVASLAPCVLDDLSEQQVDALVDAIEDPHRFAVPHPLPSVAVREPTFERKPTFLLWRGPTWLNLNWMVARGLQKHGRTRTAAGLTEQTASLVRRSGFRECYDPYDGSGMGARDFAWSTLVVDMLHMGGS